ncbi:MAG TPA: alpha/beta hydrolase [Ktedonobacteraceae bacterium]|nr:alpha/beta hydrolase [Ktedonobacteraceae bacterium]
MSKPLVFIHGSGDSGRIWRLQTEHFGPQRALAIDLPGHGQRPDIFPIEVTVPDYAHAAYEIVTGELQLEQPIIAGHSLGGAVALMMALEYGSQLGGLILIGTGARLRVHPDLLNDARQAPQQARSRLSELAGTPSNGDAPPRSSSVTQEQSASAPPILYRDLAACNVFDIMKRLYEIHLPTLVICGMNDHLTPLKYSDYLHKHIEGSTFHSIPDAGHYVMREQPEAVNQIIEDWLKQEHL